MRYGVSGLALACALGAAGWGAAGVANAQNQPSGPAPPPNIATDSNGVDLVTGALSLNDTQVSIGVSGKGGLSQVYNGGSTVNNLNAGINLSGSTYSVIINNVSENFSLSGSTFTSLEGDGATLVQSGGTYTYRAPDGTVATFTNAYNPYGQAPFSIAWITSIAHPDGETLTYTYDILPGGPIKQGGSGTIYVLGSINSNYGYQIFYSYPGSSGNQYLANTIAINNTAEACNPGSATCSPANIWPIVTYSGVSVTDALGRKTTYNNNDSAVSTTYTIVRPSGVTLTIKTDSLARVTSISNGTGTWTYAYSTSGGVQTTTVTDSLGHTRVVKSNPTLDVITSDTDGLGRTTNYTYDSYDRMTQVTYPDGNGVQYTYDTRGDITQTTVFAIPSSNLGSHVTKATYPVTCSSAPATCNKPLTVTDPNGNTTSYSYDQTTGALLTATLPAGANGVQPQTRYSYTWMSATYKNSSGTAVTGAPIQLLTGVSTCATGSAPSCVGTADETRLSISYDANNNLRPISTTVSAGNGSITATTSATYDSIGNLLTSSNPVGAVTSYLYDADREQIGVVAPAEGGTGQTTHAAQRTTYNPDGRPTLVEQGVVNSASASDWANFSSQVQTAAVYDSVGRQIQTTLSGGGAVQSLTQYSYDAANRPSCMAVRMNAATFGSEPGACTLGAQAGDGPDRITQYTYDAANELTQVVSGLGTSVQKTEEKLGYEGNGNVNYIWDGNGNLTVKYYDGFGRLGAITYPMPNSAGTTNPNDVVNFAFDANNNVVSKRQRDGTYLNMVYDSGNHMTTGGDGATYSYDNLGRQRTANYGGRNLSFAYDALGRMTSQTSNLGTLSFSYDAAGRRTKITWPDGFTESPYYNANVTLQGINENGTGFVPIVFYYNGLDQLSAIGGSNGVTTRFGFDAAARLNGVTLYFPSSDASADNTGINISYNEASQAKSISNSNGIYDWPAPANFSHAYGINGLNQVTTNGSYTFAYDAKGNLTSDGVNSYSYDTLNRLTTGPNGTSLSYDALGRLASTTTSSGTITQYLYDGQNLVATYDGSGNLQNRYVFGPGTDQPVLWYGGNGTSYRRFLLPNQQGSIIGVTDANGNLLAANTYDEYGVPGSNNVGAFQYTGQLWLASAGLYYYKARIYSPALGRFLQTDPIGYGDGPNWYNYVHGDPVNGSDPSGLDSVELDDCNDGVCPVTYTKNTGNPVVAIIIDIFTFNWGAIFGGSAHAATPKPKPSSQQAAHSVSNTSCAQTDKNAQNLDYSQMLYKGGTQSTQDHIIQNHMSGGSKSQYYNNAGFDGVRGDNAFTYRFGVQNFDRGNPVFDAPHPLSPLSLFGFNFSYGINADGQPAYTNHLVLLPDCKTVVTSYPQ